MTTRKENTNKRKRFVSIPNDGSGSGSGGANLGKYLAPLIHVERKDNSAASLKSGIDNLEFIDDAGTGKEASLSTLNADLNLRRRRRMSSFTDQMQTPQVMDEDVASYFHKVNTSVFTSKVKLTGGGGGQSVSSQ